MVIAPFPEYRIKRRGQAATHLRESLGMRTLANARVHSALCERQGALVIGRGGSGGGTLSRPPRTSTCKTERPAHPHPLLPVLFFNQGCSSQYRPHQMVVSRRAHGRSPTSHHPRPPSEYKGARPPTLILQLVSPIHTTTTISTPTRN